MQNVLSIVNTNTEEAKADFETFWLLYPRRVAKKDAQKAWSKLSESDRFDAIVALADWIRVWRARGDDQYTPYPASWLNGERWTDELPPEHRNRPQAHAPVKERPDSPKGEMPEHVKALIAKMKRGC